MADSYPVSELGPRTAAWMSVLASRRPIFHSEFDFQFALCRVMDADGVEKIRLERCVRIAGQQSRLEIDVMAELDGRRVALELKYPKKRFKGTVLSDGEHEDYDFPSSDAWDEDAADIWRDAKRIEDLVGAGVVTTGAVIALSNYEFWSESIHKEGTQPHDFRLWDGRYVAAGSVLSWYNASRKAGHPGIRLESSYTCNWHDYLPAEGPPPETRFRYLVLEPHC